MKNNAFQLSHGIKNIHPSKFYKEHTVEKAFAATTFKDFWVRETTTDNYIFYLQKFSFLWQGVNLFWKTAF